MRAEDRVVERVVASCAWCEKHFIKLCLLAFGGYNILCWYAHTETYKRSLYWNIGTINFLGWVQLVIGIISFIVYVIIVEYKINLFKTLK